MTPVKQYVYMIYDRFADLPVGSIITSQEPGQFVQLQNRNNLRQPISDAESLDIYLVAEFVNDVGTVPPFAIVGDFKDSCAKLIAAKKKFQEEHPEYAKRHDS